MSEPAAKRPSMDFDEFERRLRAPEPAPQPTGHDPLAELARLVDGHARDPYADMFRQPPRAQLPGLRAVQPGEGAPQPAAQVPPVELPGAEDWQIRREEWPPSFQQPQAAVPPAIEPPSDMGYDPSFEEEVVPAPRRSRKGVYLMAVSLVAVAAGVGATVLTRGGRHTSQDAPIIKAAQGPIKITPEAPAPSADMPTRTATVLERTPDQIGASKVVGREEQPIDVSAAKLVRPAPQAQVGGTSALFPEPRKVRTIPVRPDGTLAADSAPETKVPSATVAAATPAALPAPRPVTTASITPAAAPKVAMAAPSTPSPAPSATPALKATTRVAPPEAPAPQRTAALAKPTSLSGAVVDRSPPAATASAGGGFAVQLAATGSDAEAREKAGRLAGQFSAALGGHRPSVVQGEANGRSVYRIRVTGLSREDAAAMCGRIKGGGGACFVAH